MKALNPCRKLGSRFPANVYFPWHYRLLVYVIERPTGDGGRGIMLTEYHAVMFPLLVAAVREGLAHGA